MARESREGQCSVVRFNELESVYIPTGGYYVINSIPDVSKVVFKYWCHTKSLNITQKKIAGAESLL